MKVGRLGCETSAGLAGSADWQVGRLANWQVGGIGRVGRIGRVVGVGRVGRLTGIGGVGGISKVGRAAYVPPFCAACCKRKL